MLACERRLTRVVGWLLFAVGCGGGGELMSSLPEDKTLGTLTAGERSTLCAENTEYLSGAGFEKEACRISAVASAPMYAGENPTDAMLQWQCKIGYTECIADAFLAPSCRLVDVPAPKGCTATIAEVTACVADMQAAVHALAQQAPACDALTADAVPAPGLGWGSISGPVAFEQPASCKAVQTKCPSISDEARAFADEYCARIAPCCDGAGLGTECTQRVYAAAELDTYDAIGGAECLAALDARESSDTYCDELRADPLSQWPSVLPECERVFPDLATRPPFSDWMPATTGRPFEACVGTFVASIGPDSPSFTIYLDPLVPAQGTLCSQQEGLFCDATSHACTPVGVIGAKCASDEECEVIGRCDMETTTCTARIQIGASCAGAFDGCEEGAYCQESTMLCVRAGNLWEACSPESDEALPKCASGNCRDGVCASAIEPVCGA